MWLAEITNAATELIKKRNPSWIFLLKCDILNTCIRKDAQAASRDNQVQKLLVLVVCY